MESPTQTQTSRTLQCIRTSILVLIYLTLSTFVFTQFCTYPGVNKDRRILFSKVLEGEAYRPFAYRVLMPLLIHSTHQVIPQTFWDVFYHYRWKTGIDHELFRANIDRDYVDQWYLFRWISILCFAGFAILLSRLLQLTESVKPVEAHPCSWVGLSLIPLFFGPINTWYDPLALFLFPLCYYCLLKEKTVLYFISFILACLNKETAIFIVPFFMILYQGRAKRLLFFCQAVVYAVLFFGIRYYFRENPGGVAEFHLWNTLRFLTTPSILLMVFILKIAAISFLILSNWRDKNMEVRKCFIYTIFPLLALFLLWGRMPEIRVFYEVLFLIYILAYVSLRKLLISEPFLSESQSHTK